MNYKKIVVTLVLENGSTVRIEAGKDNKNLDELAEKIKEIFTPVKK